MSCRCTARAAASLLFALASVAGANASAVCVDELADGDVLVTDLTANQIIRLTDLTGANPNNNQERVCVGESPEPLAGGATEGVLFPSDVVNDREGRLWITMHDNVVRADPGANTQVFAGWWGLPGPPVTYPLGLAKQRDGPLFVAWTPMTNAAAVRQLDAVSGVSFEFVAWYSPDVLLGYPLGVIFDPRPGAAANDLLVSASFSSKSFVGPAIFAVNGEEQRTTGIARDGFLTAPYRLASVDEQYIYATNAPPYPGQVLQIDRSVPFDYEDPADPYVNQKVISAGGLLHMPTGIVFLDHLEFCPSWPACVLVADAGPATGTGVILRIDFDPEAADPSATSTQTLVSHGQLFSDPWGLRVVEGIDPLPPATLYVTALEGGAGVVFEITETGREVLAAGSPFERPNGIVVDPQDTNRLLVADGELPGVIEVDITTGNANPISEGGDFSEPTNVIVDSDGELIVTDQGAAKLFRVSAGGGAPVLLSPAVDELDLFRSPVSTAIDPDGYLHVTDEGSATEPGRIVLVSPATGKQWCLNQAYGVGTQGSSAINGIQDVSNGIQDIFFDENDEAVYSIDVPPDSPLEPPVPLVRRFPDADPGFFPESFSSEYHEPRGVALAENRDILTVDAGQNPGEGRVLRLDPLPDPAVEPPSVVSHSASLDEPFGVAVSGKPRLNPAWSDFDEDGIPDLEDNCVENANPDQAPGPGGMGFGLACDSLCYDPSDCLPIHPNCDANDDKKVGFPDLRILMSEYGNDCTAYPAESCKADCDGDNKVGLDDLRSLLSQYGDSVLAGPKGNLVDLDPWGADEPIIWDPLAAKSTEPLTVLEGPEIVFEWGNFSSYCVAEWKLQAGSSEGGDDYGTSGWLPAPRFIAMLSHEISDLPTEGETIYVRLSYRPEAAVDAAFTDARYEGGPAPPP